MQIQEKNIDWLNRTRAMDIWLKENINLDTDRWCSISISDHIEHLYIYPDIQYVLTLEHISKICELLQSSDLEIGYYSRSLFIKIKHFSLDKLKSYLTYNQIQMNDYSENFIDNLLKKVKII